MSELKLTFYSEGLADPEFRIKWPTGRTQMQASLVAIEKMALVNAINTNFIIANTPPGHRIYFPIGSPDASEHESVMERLKLLGDPFEGKVDTVDEVLVGLLRRRKVERKGYLSSDRQPRKKA